MNDRASARRALGRWLVTAFLERGCDPLTARVPAPVARVRPLSRGELAGLAARRPEVVFLPHRRVVGAVPGLDPAEGGTARATVLRFPALRPQAGAGSG